MYGARQHVLGLRQAGWTVRAIAREAGVGEATLYRVLSGQALTALVEARVRSVSPEVLAVAVVEDAADGGMNLPTTTVVAERAGAEPPSGPWRRFAACRGGRGSLLWFSALHADQAAAVAVCRSCPVRQPCLAEALADEGNAAGYLRFGVRGGMTPAERAAVKL